MAYDLSFHNADAGCNHRLGKSRGTSGRHLQRHYYFIGPGCSKFADSDSSYARCPRRRLMSISPTDLEFLRGRKLQPWVADFSGSEPWNRHAELVCQCGRLTGLI